MFEGKKGLWETGEANGESSFGNNPRRNHPWWLGSLLRRHSIVSTFLLPCFRDLLGLLPAPPGHSADSPNCGPGGEETYLL